VTAQLQVINIIIMKFKGVGRAWVAYGWGKRCIASWWVNRREGDHWWGIGVDGRIILRWMSRISVVGIRNGLGWSRIVRWLELVSAVMNLRVPWNARDFLASSKPVSFSRRTLHHGVSIIMKFTKCIRSRDGNHCRIKWPWNTEIFVF